MAHSHLPHEHHHDHHHAADPGQDSHDPRHRLGHAASGTRAFALGTLINLGFTTIEAAYGFVTGSLALLSDALHNLGDSLGLALGWAAAWLAQRPPSGRRTYGYLRATVLAPLASSMLLVAGAGALGWEALRRLSAPPEISPVPVIVVAGIGIAINLGSALLFRHGHAHDINQRGAYLHLLADAAVSLAVVIGATAVLRFGWRWLDPLLALAVAGVVAGSSWGLLRDSLDLALDAVPRGIDEAAVRDFLAAQPGVAAVHHLHIWALGSRETALTAHLVHAGEDPDGFLSRTADGLCERFGIAHATLQLERGGRTGCGPCP
jgi:cobalt-zinc-cadmium efflux system protein